VGIKTHSWKGKRKKILQELSCREKIFCKTLIDPDERKKKKKEWGYVTALQ
jgi:hypothetical protein